MKEKEMFQIEALKTALQDKTLKEELGKRRAKI